MVFSSHAIVHIEMWSFTFLCEGLLFVETPCRVDSRKLLKVFLPPTSKRLRADKKSEQYQLKYTTKKGEIFNLAL